MRNFFFIFIKKKDVFKQLLKFVKIYLFLIDFIFYKKILLD